MLPLARILLVGAFVALALDFGRPPVAHADDLSGVMKSLQGRWERRQQTPDGRVTITKEHKGNTTVLSVRDAKGDLVYSHTSEFKIQRSGKTHVFTFFNRQITVGRDAGKKSTESTSFVFRVANDRFIEVYGVLDGDTNEPNLIVWKRLKLRTKNQGAS